MLSIVDQVDKIRGRLSYEVRRNGVLVEAVDDCNLVVDASKQVLAKLVGGLVVNQSISQIAFGTNITAPANSNTAIASPFVKGFSGIDYPATNQVRFQFTLLASEANGMLIAEFGLLTAGGVLFARKTRSSALAKDSDLSISGNWVLTF